MFPLVYRMVSVMDWRKFLKKKSLSRILNVATGVAILSGFIDLLLWIRVSALIPSWTMFVMTACSGVLIQVIRRLL